MAAPRAGGPRVRIQDVVVDYTGVGGSSCSRGWHVLRNQWRDFVNRRGDIPNRVLSDMAPPAPIQRPLSLNLSKYGFDRMLDKIMAHYTSESPRTKAKAAVWQNASQSNNELRALLGDPWLTRRDDYSQRSTPPPMVDDPAMAFFPTDWSNCLTDETLAELIVDAYSNAFCDAFLDSAVSLVEVSSKWNAVQSESLMSLGQSMSEPSLQKPTANRRLRNTAHTDKALLQMGLVHESTSTDGFTMSGLSNDSWEAWNSQDYHKCKKLDPFVKRIEKATEMQRPQRQLNRQGPPADQRKYVWPMSTTNFPRQWESTPYRRTMVTEFKDDEELPPDKWLLRIGKDGKTTFPYSLVSHRAFLESQRDPVLKEKARKIAPLRFSSGTL